MCPSMLNPPGEYLASVFRLQEHLDELLSGGGAGSSIRAVSRAGAFAALNVGTWSDALEIYAFAPGVERRRSRSQSKKACSSCPAKGASSSAMFKKASSATPRSDSMGRFAG